jgi:hypothetical protein
MLLYITDISKTLSIKEKNLWKNRRYRIGQKLKVNGYVKSHLPIPMGALEQR